MFRIEAFCDDKNLSRVLHALLGLVHGQPAIQPVANGKVVKGEVRAKINGNLPEMFAEYIKTNKLEAVRPADIRAFAIENGYAEKSYSLLLKRLIQAKFLRKKPGGKGNKISYSVVKTTAKAK
jgi:hypothetical protein